MLPFFPKIHRLCMLVTKKMGVWVKHMKKSVTARLMMKILDGVRKLRLLHTHTRTHLIRDWYFYWYKSVISLSLILLSQIHTKSVPEQVNWRKFIQNLCKKKVPAESIYDEEVSHHACDAHSQDDNADGVVSVVRDVYSWKWVGWNHSTLVTGKWEGIGYSVVLESWRQVMTGHQCHLKSQDRSCEATILVPEWC